jgi:hypothetical protein
VLFDHLTEQLHLLVFVLNNIIYMPQKTGSKYNLSAVSKSVETVSGLQLIMIVSYHTLWQLVHRGRMSNQIRFLQFCLVLNQNNTLLSVTMLSLSHNVFHRLFRFLLQSRIIVWCFGFKPGSTRYLLI